jgi:UDP-N-acetylmuramoyl-tripeptide--D-alanyl-D-alanine ligase
MRDAAWVAQAAEGELVAGDPSLAGPRRAVVDSREAGEGDLFVGLHGANADGSRFAQDALDAGAWGALVGPARARELVDEGAEAPVIAAENTLHALGALARVWRHELGCRVIGVTGSTGKTSTKDILAALLAPHMRVHRNRENWNTEIGLPLTILEAEEGVDALVLEMAMRGEGQIAELAAIAEPDVGLIVNVGPVHLELLGTIERVAAAKAELIRDLRPGAKAVVPAGEALLEEHLRDDLETITFGPGGDVRLESFEDGRALIQARDERIELELPFDEDYNVANTVAAVAAAQALGVTPSGHVEVAFSSLRGELVELAGGVTVVNDCYNANPMSMRAALEHLAASPAERRIAVLGGMAELGDEGPRFHREIGHLADALGIDVLITVGELALPYAETFGGDLHQVGDAEEAGALLEEIATPGDRVLVKGSRSVGLEKVLA